MRQILSVSQLVEKTRQYVDASGRFSQIESINYEAKFVVYSVVSEGDGFIYNGYRATFDEIMESWKILSPGEKHPWQIKRDKEKEAQNS